MRRNLLRRGLRLQLRRRALHCKEMSNRTSPIWRIACSYRFLRTNPERAAPKGGKDQHKLLNVRNVEGIRRSIYIAKKDVTALFEMANLPQWLSSILFNTALETWPTVSGTSMALWRVEAAATLGRASAATQGSHAPLYLRRPAVSAVVSSHRHAQTIDFYTPVSSAQLTCARESAHAHRLHLLVCGADRVADD